MLCTFLEVFIIYTSLAFFCACHKLEPSFPKQSQIVIKIIMVYMITHLINSMVTQRLLPIGYSYGNRLHSSTEIKKYQYFIINKTDKSLFFFRSCCNDFVLA